MGKESEKDKVWYDEPDPSEEEDEKTAQQLKIDSRRRQVADLIFLRGHTQTEAAKILGVSVITIKRDVKAIKTEDIKKLGAGTSDEVIADARRGFDKAIQETWYMFNSIAESDKKRGLEKLKYLEQWRKAWKDKIDFEMAVGIIEKAPTKSVLDINEKSVKEMTTEELKNKRLELAKLLHGEKGDGFENN